MISCWNGTNIGFRVDGLCYTSISRDFIHLRDEELFFSEAVNIYTAILKLPDSVFDELFDKLADTFIRKCNQCFISYGEKSVNVPATARLFLGESHININLMDQRWLSRFFCHQAHFNKFQAHCDKLYVVSSHILFDTFV